MGTFRQWGPNSKPYKEIAMPLNSNELNPQRRKAHLFKIRTGGKKSTPTSKKKMLGNGSKKHNEGKIMGIALPRGKETL